MAEKIIDPWGSELVEDYEKIVKDFGLETFDPKLFPQPNRLMRRGIIFAGRDLKIIADAIKMGISNTVKEYLKKNPPPKILLDIRTPSLMSANWSPELFFDNFFDEC